MTNQPNSSYAANYGQHYRYVSDVSFAEESSSPYEQMAANLSLLKQRLHEKQIEANRFKAVLDALEDLYLIVDEEGVILDSNGVLTEKYAVRKSDIIGNHVKTFFKHPSIGGSHNIDFDRGMIYHGISPGMTEIEKFSIRLRVSCKRFKFSGKNGRTYLYKIEAISEVFNPSRKTNQLKIKKLESTLTEMIELIEKSSQQEDLLNQIRETYMDKASLTLIETMILKSIEELG